MVVCAVNSVRWIDRPFPGFLLWENLLVPAVSDTDWTGHEAGVPYLSRLQTMNGHPVASAAEVYRFAAHEPEGTPVRYTFVRAHDDRPIELTVPTMRLLVSDYFWTFGNYLLTGAALVFLGFVVYLMRPDSPAARAMLVFAAIWGLFLVTSADIFGPAWFRPLCRVLEALGPVAGVHLALAFPVERPILARRPLFLPGLYAFGLTVGIVDNVLFNQWFAAVHAIVLLNSGGVMLGGLVLLGSLLEAYYRPPSPAVRQRTKIAVLGCVFAFVVPVVGFLVRVLLGVNVPLNYATLSVAIFPAAIGIENFTGGMGSAAFVAYLSLLCNARFTATQYALLSALAAVPQRLLSAYGGVLAEQLGWVPFFLVSTVAALPGLLLLVVLMRRYPLPKPAT